MLWQGWSSDKEQAAETTVLAGLLNSLNGRETTETTGDLIRSLQITNEDAGLMAVRFVERGLFEDTLTDEFDQNLFWTTELGLRVNSEFRDARKRERIAPAARTALLRWLYEIPDTSWPHTSEILSWPHSWFYGVQFTNEQLADAANHLIQSGYVEGRPQTMGRPGRRIQMLARGTTCVERFDANPYEMEASMTGTGNVNIGTINQSGGNAAFLSKVDSQTSTTNSLTMGQTARDLAALLRAIRDSEGIPDDEFIEAEDIENALVAGSDGSEEQAKAAVGRAHRFFQRLGKLAEPGTAALLTAAGNYAAVRMGMSP